MPGQYWVNNAEVMKAVSYLRNFPMVLAIGKTSVAPSHDTIYSNITAATIEGGVGEVELGNDVVVVAGTEALVASKWNVFVDANGKAECRYGSGYTVWTMAAANYSRAETFYNYHFYTRRLTFTSGSTEPLPGQTITGATSSKTAVVAFVDLRSGTWSGGDAAGYIFIKAPSGNLQAENIDIGVSTNVATISGNYEKILMQMETFTEGVKVELDSDGNPSVINFRYWPRWTEGTA